MTMRRIILPQAMRVDSEEVAFQRQLTVLQMVSAVVAGNGVIEPEERITINFVSPLNQLADVLRLSEPVEIPALALRVTLLPHSTAASLGDEVKAGRNA